jgi:transcription antitermination factor NusG
MQLMARTESAVKQDLGWFALRVRPKHEKSVFRLIEYQGLEQLLPLHHVRRWATRTRDVQVPVFPGYLFCRFDRKSWARVVQTPGVIDVVRSGGAPVGICNDEMASLQRLRTGLECNKHTRPRAFTEGSF